MEQDSVFISTTIVGGNDEISVQAFINNVNSGEAVAVDLVNNNGNWSVHWAPETESFFDVDLQLINGAENDTVFYENVGYFTSLGLISVNMVGDLIAYPGDGAVFDFIDENDNGNGNAGCIFLFSSSVADRNSPNPPAPSRHDPAHLKAV